jgi:hypothetical protein
MTGPYVTSAPSNAVNGGAIVEGRAGKLLSRSVGGVKTRERARDDEMDLGNLLRANLT